MALAQVKIVAIFLLATVATAQAEDATVASGSLDAAKRDLQNFPSGDQPTMGPESANLKIDVPSMPSDAKATSRAPTMSLLPSTGAGKIGANPDNPNAKPSEGWLVDAFKASDAKAQEQRAVEEQRAKALPSSRVPSNAATAPNPFTPYMNQWLSPHDPVLLQIIGPNSTATAIPGVTPLDSFGANSSSAAPAPSGNNSALNPSSNNSSALAPGSGNSLNSLFSGADSNPYLSTPSPSTNGMNAMSVQNPSSFASPTVSSTSGMSTQPATGHRPAKLAEPAYTPPTAPLIDERKYFPQLHRF